MQHSSRSWHPITGTTTLSSLLLESLWEYFVAPIVLWPLLQPTALDAADQALLRKVSASAASDALHQLTEPLQQQDRASWQEQDLPPGACMNIMCMCLTVDR